MHRTALRLSGFAVVLAVLFTGGWAVGAQLPTDDDPAPHEMDHTGHADTTGREPADPMTTDPMTTDPMTTDPMTTGGQAP